MASKYAKVLPGLKPAPVADVGYQQKVDEVKLSLISDEQGNRRSATDLALIYADLCDEDAVVKRLQYDINLKFEALTQLLTASQAAAEAEWGKYGVEDNALRLETGDTFRVQPEPYGQVMNKEEFRRWCVENGYERQLQLWPSIMNAVCKERLLEGKPLPDGCDVFLKTKIVYTPKKEK